MRTSAEVLELLKSIGDEELLAMSFVELCRIADEIERVYLACTTFKIIAAKCGKGATK